MTKKLPPKKPENKSSWIMQINHHTSLVNNRRLRTEAHLEHAFVLKASFRKRKLLDIETKLDSVTTESFTRYTPDVRETEIDGLPHYRDIRGDKGANDPKELEKFKTLEREYAEAGSKFSVARKSEFYNRDEITNLKRFYIALTSIPPDQTAINLAVKIVEKQKTIHLGKLAQLLLAKGLGAGVIWFCLAKGELTTDRTIRINQHSKITIGGNDENCTA